MHLFGILPHVRLKCCNTILIRCFISTLSTHAILFSSIWKCLHTPNALRHEEFQSYVRERASQLQACNQERELNMHVP